MVAAAAPAPVVPPENTKPIAGIPPESLEAAAAIVAAVIGQLTQEFVMRSEFEQIPEQIRTMGCGTVQNAQGGAGDSFLGLHGPNPRTAGWIPSEGLSGMDYDKVYIGGIEYTPGANPNGYDFLQIGSNGSSSWIPAMISPMPTGYEIYNVKKNHIHITGATAGNI
jgi:hypothetical protein